VSKLDPLKMVPILEPITSKMLSASKFGPFLLDQVLALRDQFWTIELDLRKDQRILIKKYLMTFKPFSRFHTENLVAILPIFKFSSFVCTNSYHIILIILVSISFKYFAILLISS